MTKKRTPIDPAGSVKQKPGTPISQSAPKRPTTGLNTASAQSEPEPGAEPEAQPNAGPPAPPPPPPPSEERKRGRGHPPPEHQWPPGTSGNLKGRPREGLFEGDRKRSLGSEIIRQFKRKVTIIEGGKEVRITYRELLARRIVTDALKEDKATRRFLLNALQINLRGADQEEPDSERDANMLRNLGRAFLDPTLTEEDFKRMEQEVTDEMDRRMGDAQNDDEPEDPGETGNSGPSAA